MRLQLSDHNPPARELSGADGTTIPFTYCSHVYEVAAHTTGPWHDGNWLSIPCPGNERPMMGGAGFDSTPEHALTFIDGGFGYNRDGWWHYRFHNWGPVTARVEFWAFCPHKS